MTGRRGLSPIIFVGRPDLIDLADDVEYEHLGDALNEAAKTATEITILGGFYSVEPLIALCRNVPPAKRRTCRIRIAVGLDAASSIPKTWEDMRRLRKALIDLRFVDPIVSIVDSKPVHFHTKLYRFLHTTQPMWFVGSANPGSSRHELMVRFAGRHDGLSSYVAAAFAKAADVSRTKPTSGIASLRDFIMTGVLCHKPPVHRLFTFNAFHIEPEHREQLAAALAGSSGVSHASPETKGFGFNLRSALPEDMQDDPFIVGAKASRVPVARYSIDTVFGRWMPDAYASRLRRKVAHEEAARAERLVRIGQALRPPEGQAAVRNALEDHVVSMGSFLERQGIDARPISNREARFGKFLANRVRSLTDPDTVQRYARSVVMTDMPDIWADGTAVEDFIESFFDDFAYRASEATRPIIVKSILEWLDDPSLAASVDFREAMESGLIEQPWEDDDWYLP